MSRTAASFCSCCTAISQTMPRLPSRSVSCSFFFPVGLIRSPIIVNGPSSLISLWLRSDARNLFRSVFTGRSGTSASFSAIARICSGVVPQQPPNMRAPAPASFAMDSANSCGCISYCVLPPDNFGIPAFGLTRMGTFAASYMAAVCSSMRSGPMEQFIPTADAPRLCKTITAVFGSVP